MAGLHSFFKSDRFSDTTLEIFFSTNHSLSTHQDPTPLPEAELAVPSDVNVPAVLEDPPITDSVKDVPLAAVILEVKQDVAAAADPETDSDEEDLDEEPYREAKISISSHKMTLASKSEYLNTLLSTDVSSNSSSPVAVLLVRVGTLAEMCAMESVVEFMYSDKLPLESSPDNLLIWDGIAGQRSYIQRLLSMLQAANVWQVDSCVTACCSAICNLPAAGLVWNDCYAMHQLPAGLRDEPRVAKVIEFATKLALLLTLSFDLVASQTSDEVLDGHLWRLPSPVRLKLLTCGRLGYRGMLALLRSDARITHSEDNMAMHLSTYLDGATGKLCSPVEVKALKDQLRYQHMSNAFVGLKLPQLSHVRLDAGELSQLLYLRQLEGLNRIPAARRQPSVPAAWYKVARWTFEPAFSSSIELALNISVSALEAHLAAVVVSKTSGTAPVLGGVAVEFAGVSWVLQMNCSATREDLFFVCLKSSPTPSSGGLGALGAEQFSAFKAAGNYAEMTFRVESASPSINPSITHTFKNWIGGSSLGIPNLLKHKLEDATELAWWEKYIIDGHVRISATVKILS